MSLTRLLLPVALLLCPFAGGAPGPVGASGLSAASVAWNSNPPAADDGRGTPYKVDKCDNICGLTEPRQLTQPAQVDYQLLLEATSEHQELTKKKIDPNSAKGIELLAKARDRVRVACETLRVQGSYCSVWKAIERRDGTAIPDITDLVKQSL